MSNILDSPRVQRIKTRYIALITQSSKFTVNYWESFEFLYFEKEGSRGVRRCTANNCAGE